MSRRKKKDPFGSSVTRRDLITHACLGAGGWFLLPRFVSAQEQAANSGQLKFLQIFLNGGWDSGLATDPVRGSKASSAAYASAYSNYTVDVVTGKDQLHIGQGLIPAKAAFAALPTCFVNGIFMEVTAHELAQNYMYSGTLSLSRSREFPAVPARLGNAAQAFPPFVSLGRQLPLGSLVTNPPLHSQAADQLKDMLNPFEDTPTAVSGIANNLLGQLNTMYSQGLSTQAGSSLETWNNSQARLTELYSRNFNLEITQALQSRYNVTQLWQDDARIPAAFLILQSGLSKYVSISLSGYDTHTNHFDQHVPLLEGFAGRLNTLVQDLQATPDPDDPTKTLAQTTIISVMSEFVRTPLLNGGSGTDHWQSASAILMGPGVADNKVVGTTDDAAEARGWDGSSAVTRTAQTAILPDHLSKALVKKILPAADDDELGSKSLDDVFSS